jgi:ribose 5-phosphate isomerase B
MAKNYKIYIGSDHAGFELKKVLTDFLIEKGYLVSDLGPQVFDFEDDYPIYIRPVADAVAHDAINRTDSRGIIIGGSGQGEAMCANRIKGVRAAVYYGVTLDIVTLSRKHNDSNILSLGARFINNEQAKTAVSIWLKTEFSGDERHLRRIVELDE